MIKITDDLKTGIETIDSQHLELVEAVNKLTSLGENAKNPAVLTETLDFLENYIKMHFEQEGDLMEECKYNATGLHKNQHALFIDKFEDYKESFEEEGYNDDLFHALNHFLETWIVNHIKVSDLAFANFYHSRTTP